MQDADTVLVHEAPAPGTSMLVQSTPAERQPALPFRSDTILGVCEALGQDFGFNPNYLRVALASLLLWNPWAVVGIYLTLGVAVALSRWIYPRTVATAAPQPAAQPHAPAADNQAEDERLAA